MRVKVGGRRGWPRREECCHLATKLADGRVLRQQLGEMAKKRDEMHVEERERALGMNEAVKHIIKRCRHSRGPWDTPV